MKSTVITVPVRRMGPATRDEQDWVAVEEPLEIKLGRRTVAITMRTPGNDDELGVGFLFTEGILSQRDDVTGLHTSENGVTVKPRRGLALDAARLRRNFYTTSSCGVCGKASVDAVRVTCPFPARKGSPIVSATLIQQLPTLLRKAQRGFDRTGGQHAAGLFDTQGTLIATREDVGRHNAVDKLVGRAFLDGALPLRDAILVLSGRVSFELVQKAAMAGIPIVAAIGAPSSLAIETARRLGITIAGFVRDGKFNVYSSPERITA